MAVAAHFRISEKPIREAGVCPRASKQGRQDSNLQPPVLETGALPVELRP
jgi:hypothetical protein